MRIVMAGILWLSSLVCFAQIQQAQPHPYAPAQDGGVREVLESIVIPPIAHAPFTATLATEWVRYSDGATITFVNQRRIARDDLGRIYEERWLLVPKDSDAKSRMNWIQIADPNKRLLYNCNIEKHACDLLIYRAARDLSAAAPPTGSSHSLPNGRGEVTWEDLGSRTIAGVETLGSRETTTLNAGTMGNDAPLTSTKEFWRCQQLAMNLLSIRTSPMFGKQTFTVTELSASDPDPQLFEVPSGYEVRDRRKDFPEKPETGSE
jgi:hypothetical protein